MGTGKIPYTQYHFQMNEATDGLLSRCHGPFDVSHILIFTGIVATEQPNDSSPVKKKIFSLSNSPADGDKKWRHCATLYHRGRKGLTPPKVSSQEIGGPCVEGMIEGMWCAHTCWKSFGYFDNRFSYRLVSLKWSECRLSLR